VAAVTARAASTSSWRRPGAAVALPRTINKESSAWSNRSAYYDLVGEDVVRVTGCQECGPLVVDGSRRMRA
jgi:hypothetical protein